MAKVTVILCAVFLGCADSRQGAVGPLPDFTVVESSRLDLSVEDSADQGMPEEDLATTAELGRDFAVQNEDLLVTPPQVMCDLGLPDGGAKGRLYLAGVGSGNALLFESFDEGTGWMPIAVTGAVPVSELAIGLLDPGSRPVVVAMQPDTTLSAGLYDPCTNTLSAPSQLFTSATTSVRPAIVGGSTADVIFRGSVSGDARYYHTASQGNGWSIATTQSNFLSVLPPTAVRSGGALHTLFTGTNSQIYDGVIEDTPGGGSPAIALPGGGPGDGGVKALSSHEPATVLDGDGNVQVVFTGQDFPSSTPPSGRLYWMARQSDGSYSAPQDLCHGQGAGCFIASDLAPALATTVSGNVLVAFHGTDNKVYTSELLGSTWTPPLPASGSETTHLAPAVATGVGTASAELVYVRSSDSAARHTRLIGGTWQSAVVLTGTSMIKTPAIASVGGR